MGRFFISNEERSQLSAIHENYAVISFNTDGIILDANENFLKALGYELSEVKGKHHRMFCESSYANSAEYQSFWKDLNTGQAQISEFRRVKKDGQTIFIQASYTPIKNNRGNVVQIIKFAQDITQRKLETLYYEGQLEAIGKSQAVIEFNMHGIIKNANDNFLSAMGYGLDEIVGQHHSMFCEESYQNSSEYKMFWQKLNEGHFHAGEYLRLGKGKKEIWIQATYNPIKGFDGKPFRVVKYATDITQRKETMFQVEKRIKELTTSLNNLSSSSASMSKGADISTRGSEEVSNAISEINQAVSDVSKKIESMLTSMNSISSASTKSEKVSKEATDQSKNTTTAMYKLSEESERIGETISIISQIAFQTNILSLNAAVEAATAGESGKGFAVVAQEVRNLATRSDDAAQKITSAIENIQALVKTSLDSITTIDKTIEEITNMSTEISTSISEQEVISSELASAATQASQSVNEVSSTMQDVSQNADITKKESEKTVDASKNLIEVSNGLISTLKALN